MHSTLQCVDICTDPPYLTGTCPPLPKVNEPYLQLYTIFMQTTVTSVKTTGFQLSRAAAVVWRVTLYYQQNTIRLGKHVVKYCTEGGSKHNSFFSFC